VCVCSLSYLACAAHEPCYIVICGLSGCTTIFYMVSQTAGFLGKNFWIQKVCFFSTNLSEKFLTVRRIQQDTIIKRHLSSCRVTIILIRFYPNFNFLEKFSKHTEIWNSIKIQSQEAELLHVNGWTDIMNSRFSHILWMFLKMSGKVKLKCWYQWRWGQIS
jgi:hypothetical protein